MTAGLAAAPVGAGRRRAPLVVLVAAGAGIVAGGVGAVLLYRRALRVDVQPSPAAGAPDVLVTHWSTPWVLAAAGAALAALLLAVTLVGELVRRRTDPLLVPDPALDRAAVIPAFDRLPAPDAQPGSDPDDAWRPPAPAAR